MYTAYSMETRLLAGYNTKMLRIGDAELEVFIADTQEKRTQGLMGISELTPNAGMIFIFPELLPRTFWNKNTLIPLDLIWIAGGQVVGVSALPSITESNNQIVSVPSPRAIDTVLEVHAGWAEAHGVETGDVVE